LQVGRSHRMSQQIVVALPDPHIEMRPDGEPERGLRRLLQNLLSRRFSSAHLPGPPAISTAACGCFRKPVRQATAADPGV
jgi:hypothetical protein